MFDAKSILEGIVRAASPQGQATPQSGQGAAAASESGSLGDILSDLSKRLGGNTGSSAAPGQSGGDILDQLRAKIAEAGGSITDGGSVTDILGKVLSQASQGVQDGANATGATDVLRQITDDPKAQELLAKAKQLIAQNQFTAGAAAGGLGGLVLGTQTGRSLAASAAKVGAVAMIGGLAYKAYQNYQGGKPLITGATTASAPPAGSGFEPAAVTNDTATRIIQAMIAAAAADGTVSANERARIMANLGSAQFGPDAEQFLANAISHPKSPQEIASGVTSPEEAVQIYTAARLNISGSSPAEAKFLRSLASALNIDPKLAEHIDATTSSAAAA